MRNRIILHIDMDYFFAQIEERENPQFKGKPVVVGADPAPKQVWYGAGPKPQPAAFGGGLRPTGRAAPSAGGELRPTGRGVVSTCNYVARKYGIRSSMPISEAWRRCPKAVFLPVSHGLYEKVSEKIFRIVKKYSPLFEQVSLDEAYLDISGENNHGNQSYLQAEKIAKKLKKEILEKENLTSTVGIGPNKLIAKMATNKDKPNGLLIIKPEQVKNFLESLDIEELPGIGPKTAEKLRAISVNKIKELKNIPKTKLKEMFGKIGESIYQKARGIDESPVTSEEIIKSIGKEHTFEKDTRDPEIIFKTFDNLIVKVGQELFLTNFSFKTITVVCRFSGFETHTKSKTLYPLLTPRRGAPRGQEGANQNFQILEKEAKKLLLKFIIENPKPIRLVGLRVAVV